MWFTETPWPPIFICSVLAALCVIGFFSTQRGRYLVFAAGLLVLSGIIFSLERMIVTEAEHIETAVFDLTSSFQKKDLEQTLSFFSKQNFTDRALMVTAMELVTVHDDLRVSDVMITMESGNTTAKSHFRANGTITMMGNSFSRWAVSRWEMTWQKEEGEWRITNTRRLHPIRDEEMGLLDQRME